MKQFLEKIISRIKLFIDRLSSQKAIGGLEVGDSALRFLRIEGTELSSGVLRLTPGIVGQGKILDRNNLLEAFGKLHAQIENKPKTIVPVVVSLPSESVFTQTFSVPDLPDEQLKESAALNLQMISPIERLETAYYSWQKVGKRLRGGGQIDMLGAFVDRTLVDELNGILKETGFYPVAFEFPALAVARVFRSFINAPGLYLIIDSSADGIDFLIVQNGNLYFSYFHSWKFFYGEAKKVKLNEFQEILRSEIQKLFNFVNNHFQGRPQGAYLVAQELEKEIAQVVQAGAGLKVIPFRLARYPFLSPSWLSVFGSSLRGLISRSRDQFISLAWTGAVQEFYQTRILSFVVLWRNIIAASLVVILLAFVGSNLFIRDLNNRFDRLLSTTMTRIESQETVELQSKAAQFNRAVALIKSVKDDIPKWSPLFDKLLKVGGAQINFDRIGVRSVSDPVTIQGRASNERAAIDFKNRMAAQPQFSSVNLPLSLLVAAGDGSVSFSLSFKLEGLDFQ